MLTNAIDRISATGLARAFAEPAAATSTANFDRRVVGILGLPFDAVGIDQAVLRIRSDAFAGRRCFVSTPNLHFALAAQSDPAFRGTVLESDLSLIDGMPLVWISRLTGVPVPGRVAGADVFEALQTHEGRPVTVFLFGGPPGAAAAAAERINQRGGGLRCVGHDAAGFGSVESMSDDALIERINRSGAHFVVASLGAEKGQAWLARNADRLTAPILAHLGAVLNFAAGTVRRAPRWMQSAGLEWLWRIMEEPGLWRRYVTDGALAMRLLLTRVVPDLIASRAAARGPALPKAVEVRRSPGLTTLRLRGSWLDVDCRLLRQALRTVAGDAAGLVVDLMEVDKVGAPFVGLMLVAQGHFAASGTIVVRGARPGVAATFRRKLAGHLLAD